MLVEGCHKIFLWRVSLARQVAYRSSNHTPNCTPVLVAVLGGGGRVVTVLISSNGSGTATGSGSSSSSSRRSQHP